MQEVKIREGLTLSEARRVALLIALKERKEVFFVFKNRRYEITPRQAWEELPEHMRVTMTEIEMMKKEMDSLIKKVQEEAEAIQSYMSKPAA